MFEQKGLKMNIKLLQTLRNYNKDNFIKDIIAGIIIMAVSIPISMGYAQIAGLPAVYGLDFFLHRLSLYLVWTRLLQLL